MVQNSWSQQKQITKIRQAVGVFIVSTRNEPMMIYVSVNRSKTYVYHRSVRIYVFVGLLVKQKKTSVHVK